MDKKPMGMAELNTPHWDALKRRDRRVAKAWGYLSWFVLALVIVGCLALLMYSPNR